MKAILLARVSTEEQNTESQLIKLKEYADKEGFEYTKKDIFDFHESAYKSNREHFQEVIAYLNEQKDKVALCCDKVDRLLRNFLHIRPIQELLEKDKLELHFPSDNLVLRNDSYATDKFKFNLGALLAQYYSDAISDNVKRSIYKRIKSGQILGKAPYGYRNLKLDDDTKTVEVDPFEASVVLKIFEWYATGSYALSEIKDKIYKDFGVKLGKSTIAKILENKFYIGIAEYKKQGTEYQHIYSTIVPSNIFYTAQEVKAGRNPFLGSGIKYSGKEFFYRGLINCSACGYSISPEEHRGKKYYCCTEYGGKHGAQYVNEDILTNEFAEAFSRITISESTAQKIILEIHQLNETNLYMSQELIDNLRKEKDKTRKRRSKLYDAYFDESITKDMYEEKLKQYDTELKRIEDKLRNVEKVDKDFYVTAEYIIQLAKHSSALFKCSEYEERRLLINTVLLNVKWNGVNLCYDYKEPFNLLAEMNQSTVWGE